MNLVFLGFAALMVAAAIGYVLRPLLGRGRRHGAPQAAVDAAVYRDRLDELDAERAAGAIGDAEFAEARLELERAALERLEPQATVPQAPDAPGRRPRAAAAIAIVIAGASVAMYALLGEPAGIGAPARPAGADDVEAMHRTIGSMVGRLEERLQAQPDDAEGWAMLARSYLVLDRADEAGSAFEKAYALAPDDPRLLGDYAEYLAGRADGALQGRASELIARALEVAPDEPRVLWLAGAAAFQAGDNLRAVQLLERFRAAAELSPEEATFIDDVLGRAREGLAAGPDAAAATAPGDAAPAAAPGVALTVSVTIAEALRTRAAPGDAVFVFARAATGPPMPLAVERHTVADLPLTVTLDDADAMTPAMRLSQAGEIVVGARVSKSGDPVRRPGDLEGLGAPRPVAGGGALAIEIDTVAQ